MKFQGEGSNKIMNITRTIILGIIHWLDSLQMTTFWKLGVFQSSGSYFVGPVGDSQSQSLVITILYEESHTVYQQIVSVALLMANLYELFSSIYDEKLKMTHKPIYQHLVCIIIYNLSLLQQEYLKDSTYTAKLMLQTF